MIPRRVEVITGLYNATRHLDSGGPNRLLENLGFFHSAEV